MKSAPHRSRSIYPFAIAASATAIVGVPLRKCLEDLGRLDVPNHRSSHHHPIPRGGGLACLLGASIAAFATKTPVPPRFAISILSLAALGWQDDVTGHVPASTRLIGQVSAGALGLSHSVADVPVAALTTAGIVNVVNFMDGINGISGLSAVVWGVNAMLLRDETGDMLDNLGALVAGAGLGFLPHNIPRAQMFLGDIGSYALGATIAGGILSQRTLKARYRAGAPLLLYAADAGQALIRRRLARANLSEAHRDHIYQQLVDVGLSHFSVAALHATGATAMAVSSRISGPTAWVAPMAICGIYIATPKLSSKLRNIRATKA